MAGKTKEAGPGSDLFGEPWVEPKDPRGRKRHKRDPQVAEIVKLSRADGMKIEEIAARVQLSPPTLRHYYFPELTFGPQQLRAEVFAALAAQAKKGNVSAAKEIIRLLEKAEAAVPISKGQAAALRAEPVEPALGKKAAADRDAKTAHEGTEWGDLLH